MARTPRAVADYMLAQLNAHLEVHGWELAALPDGHPDSDGPWWHLRFRAEEHEDQPWLARFCWHVDCNGCFVETGAYWMEAEIGQQQYHLRAYLDCMEWIDAFGDAYED